MNPSTEIPTDIPTVNPSTEIPTDIPTVNPILIPEILPDPSPAPTPSPTAGGTTTVAKEEVGAHTLPPREQTRQ